MLQVHPADQFDEAVLAAVETTKLAFSVPQGTEVVCREAGHRCLLHIVQHEPLPERTTKAAFLTLPAWLQARTGVCQWFSPDWNQPREIALHAGMPLDVSRLPTYSIVALDR
jgi:hypothetical protein